MKAYLGDGLYAEFDGWQIILRAPRETGETHWIGLEPRTYTELIDFARRINIEYKAKHFKENSSGNETA